MEMVQTLPNDAFLDTKMIRKALLSQGFWQRKYKCFSRILTGMIKFFGVFLFYFFRLLISRGKERNVFLGMLIT